MNIKKALMTFSSLLVYACGLSWLYFPGLPGFYTHCLGAVFLAAGLGISVLSLRILIDADGAAAGKGRKPGAVPQADGCRREMEEACLGFFEKESPVEIARSSVGFCSDYFSLEGAVLFSSDESSLCSVLASKGVPEDIAMFFWNGLKADLPEGIPAARVLPYPLPGKSSFAPRTAKLAAAVCPLICRNVVQGYLLLLRCGETKRFSTQELDAARRFSRYLAAALSLSKSRLEAGAVEHDRFELQAA